MKKKKRGEQSEPSGGLGREKGQLVEFCMPFHSVYCHFFPIAKPGPRIKVSETLIGPGFLMDRKVTLCYFQFEQIVSIPELKCSAPQALLR